MKATDIRITSKPQTACPADRTGLLLGRRHEPEGSAAFAARVKAAQITAELDHFRSREPIAGRLVQALLIRQLAVDLAPALLELLADVAQEGGAAP